MMTFMNNKGSLLVSTCLLFVFIIMILSIYLSLHFDHIYRLQLEKDHRLGKLLIHQVYRDLSLNPGSNNTVSFNESVVTIEKTSTEIVFICRLHNGAVIQQRYAVSSDEK